MQYKDLERELRKLGFDFSQSQLQGLMLYISTLLKWNRSINLVGYNNWLDILHYLVVDSFYLGRFLEKIVSQTDTCSLDLGAGAGLPGVPLRLVWNPGDYYLVESRVKRAAFLRQILHLMGLEKTYVLNKRAEDLPQDILPADLILSRAFMPWNRLLPLAGSLLAPGGKLVILGSEDIETRDLSGFNPLDRMDYLAGGKNRCFWALEKL